MAGRKLFGTDGVRGVAGEFLTAELATALGRAAAAEAGSERAQVVVVRDTRESGEMLEAALAAGITAAGGDALVAGVLPTPAASILVRRFGLDLGAVVSASHNPYRDNGIKFFSAAGVKLDSASEARIEERMEEPASAGTIGRLRSLEGGLDDYLRALTSSFPLKLEGTRVVLDCANGATYRAAPLAFERLGAEVEVLGAEPDGRNINVDCGSTHIEALVERMAQGRADIGFAFDGDGDRVLAVDRQGRVHDGDELIALAALHLHAQGALSGVAVTVMTNYGFHRAMADTGIDVATTAVGDRHVHEAMAERGFELGGEQSGHIIWVDHALTGDGIASALLTLTALEGADLADARPFEKLPQKLQNVEVSDPAAAAESATLRGAIDREAAALEGRGRVLVRPSGTEPLLRVMVEAPSEEECEAVCSRLVEAASRAR
jgi:phosphoglucosamine mutase